jgi:hypothetical protein
LPKRKPPPKTLASPVPLTGDLERERSRTYPGQASWAAVCHLATATLEGTTCRECEHWEFNGYLADGVIRKGVCRMALSMMRANNIGKGVPVPDYAGACKYFDRNKYPPPRIKGER